jgi:hypothetical protein
MHPQDRQGNGSVDLGLIYALRVRRGLLVVVVLVLV